MLISIFFFFFSSRRRHTRLPRDWSSDVCSSDLSCARGKTGPDSLAISTKLWLQRKTLPGVFSIAAEDNERSIGAGKTARFEVKSTRLVENKTRSGAVLLRRNSARKFSGP